MRSAAPTAPAASAQQAAQVRTAAAWARLQATLAALATKPRTGPPAGYVPRQWHTLAEPCNDPLSNPATDPDRWAQFI